MFDQTYQSGFISLLYSVGPRPLQLCEKHEEVPGSVRRVLDEDVQSSVVELSANNIVHTWLRFPCGADEQKQELPPKMGSLHIRLRHLVVVLKNVEQHVSLEIHVADDRGVRRRFRLSTFQKKSAVHPQLVLLPLHLDSGWNQVQVDLAELLYTSYKGRYAHAISVQLHACCRVRRIYFAEKMLPESQLPAEFRLFKRLSKEQTQQFRERQ
ncbi:Cilia- and flagella-associated protein 20 [Phytophthora citrophthora]|uniref:Cilia- and flagella-associated protein 20 n=1 Tax=Phytophthora citrophthora TaxID=4793 RepID=A0AAD9LAQ9_9STRA|nr:Cilia- and flagella-associated protein 20 [Phytophthora citrophthora]